jgi:hypothetical protein
MIMTIYVYSLQGLKKKDLKWTEKLEETGIQSRCFFIPCTYNQRIHQHTHLLGGFVCSSIRGSKDSNSVPKVANHSAQQDTTR